MIIRGLMALYKRYKKRKFEQDKDKLVLIQIEVPVSFEQTQIQAVEQATKEALGIDFKRPFQLVKSVNRRSVRSNTKSQVSRSASKTIVHELVLKHVHQPSQQEIDELMKKIRDELAKSQATSTMQVKVSSGRTKTSVRSSFSNEPVAMPIILIKVF